jgi:hypothetical protein
MWSWLKVEEKVVVLADEELYMREQAVKSMMLRRRAAKVAWRPKKGDEGERVAQMRTPSPSPQNHLPGRMFWRQTGRCRQD